ncbi:MFS transporter [Pseudomonas phytophila]|uniref:MFS transporter n=1 Tax=Pseudomonas phytophila TaxID=2867264 RepID=A0ABY6F8X3_9PSED|nr:MULTISPECIES: MFS transporter [Pseudomonas]MCD5974784.1 MFS transporter [Pseudomonas quasicaspiana]MCD5976595.1 MFS transporter [Pseudomonas quasicaspiana]MCD5991835.1 MFS transporter [Pseudomonas quasicaspiana]UXZ94086.1 MFS transporter [Pseudomonas phytophila]
MLSKSIPLDQVEAQARVGRHRFLILALIFIVTVINYADRATMSIAGTGVVKDLGLDPMMLGVIFSAFAWAYALGQIPGGWLLDRFGARRVYGCSLVLWSIFTMLQGTVGWMGLMGASAAISLFAMRFMLGLVESPAFPANNRIVSCWFPTSERGTASALFNSAQYMAVVLFTPLMAWLTHSWGWEHVFLWMGGLGLVLSVVWFAFYREPHSDKNLSPRELEYMRDGGALVDLELTRTTKKPKAKLSEIKQLFTSRTLWSIYLGQYCITALTYFFITWFPIYLIKGRGMTIMEAGWVAALPAICGFSGGVLGGMLSDWMIRRGVHPSIARKTPFMIGMSMSTILVSANFLDANWMVITVMAIAFFGKGLAAVGWAVLSDTAPKNMVGLSGGVFNGIGNIAGIITPLVIGYIVAVTGSFNIALWFVAAHGVLGLLSYGLLAGRFERVVIVEKMDAI